jgi:regulator of cell morphogenesis and NO signaling
MEKTKKDLEALSQLQDLEPDHSRAVLQRYLNAESNSPATGEVDAGFFAEVLNLFSHESEWPTDQLKSFPIPVILDYLKRTHRWYIGKKLPEIELTLSQLTSSREDYPEYLSTFYQWVRQNLERHIRIEEQSLFPYIEQLNFINEGNSTVNDLERFRDFTLRRFVESHGDEVEDQLSEVKRSLVRMLNNAQALFPYRMLLQQLDRFEQDLRVHARVEDEILIPMALALETKLRPGLS